MSSYVLGTVLGSEDASVKDMSQHSWSLQSRIQQRNQPHKQRNIIVYVYLYTHVYMLYIHAYTCV